MELEVGDFNGLVESIKVIRAREILTEFTVSDWPTIKHEKRETIHKSIHKEANPKLSKPTGKVLTTADIAAILRKHG